MLSSNGGFLTPEEIGVIEQTAVLPAVRAIAGPDFFSVPGSEYHAEKLLPHSRGLRRVIMHCLVFDDPHGDSADPLYSVALTEEERMPDDTEQLMSFAQSCGGEGSKLANYQDRACAWSVIQYYFSNDPNTPAYVDRYDELQDDEGTTLWEPSDVEEDAEELRDGSEHMLDEHEDAFSELAEGLETGMTCTDCIGALAVLGELGVPSDKISELIRAIS